MCDSAAYRSQCSTEQECDSDSTFGSPPTPPLSPTNLESDTEHHEVQFVSLERASDLSPVAGHSSSQPPTNEQPNTKITKGRHSLKDIRKMRKKRKMRKRFQRILKKKECAKQAIRTLEKEVKKEKELSKKNEAQIQRYKCMARSYWDRWQWELQKRKEVHREQALAARCLGLHTVPKNASIDSSQPHEINPDHLVDPVQNGKSSKLFIGRGSFSVVRLKTYREMIVAVKELLPHTLCCDVYNEARILNKLCHPFLPYLFGICTTTRPFRIVTQFHGIDSKPVTLRQELMSSENIPDSKSWMVICIQLLEAVKYLHSDVQVIHNDIQASNIVFTNANTSSGIEFSIHVVLIDFGKATSIESGVLHRLSEEEQMTYLSRYLHIAPEIVRGEYRQSTYSDIFSVGHVFTQIKDKGFFNSLPCHNKNKLFTLIQQCRSVRFDRRPNAIACLKTFQKISETL